MSRLNRRATDIEREYAERCAFGFFDVAPDADKPPAEVEAPRPACVRCGRPFEGGKIKPGQGVLCHSCVVPTLVEYEELVTRQEGELRASLIELRRWRIAAICSGILAIAVSAACAVPRAIEYFVR